jgi:hypothetical protein
MFETTAIYKNMVKRVNNLPSDISNELNADSDKCG